MVGTREHSGDLSESAPARHTSPIPRPDSTALELAMVVYLQHERERRREGRVMPACGKLVLRDPLEGS